MEIFTGNLPHEITQQEIIDAFSQFGAVARVKMLTDKFTGKFRGMAFVQMDDETEAANAINSLNNSDLGGREIKVEAARPREARPYNNGFRRSFDGPREGNGGGYRPRGFGGPRQGGGYRGQGGYRGPREGGGEGGYQRQSDGPRDFNRGGFSRGPKRDFRPRGGSFGGDYEE